MIRFFLILVLFTGCVTANYFEGNLIKTLENESDQVCLAENKIHIRSTFYNFRTCLDKLQTYFDIAMQANQDPIEAAIVAFCKNPVITDCVNELRNTLVKCLHEEKLEFLNNLTNSFFAGLETACGLDGQGQPIKDLMYKGGECLNVMTVMKLVQCEQHSNNETVVAMPTAADCIEVEELKKCILSAFDTCQNDIPKDFFEKLFNNMMKYSPCPGY